MAGRQKHAKRTYDLTSPLRYKGKMYGLFAGMMGKEVAMQLADAMLQEYENTSVAFYTKVRDSPLIRNYLDEKVGSALQFLAFQLINEFISSVLLTRNETATMVLYKYTSQGLPEEVALQLMAITSNILGNELPSFTAVTGGEDITSGNVVKMVNQYVLNSPPAPRSYGGKLSAKNQAVVPNRYAGTKSFSSYSEVNTAVDDLKRALSSYT